MTPLPPAYLALWISIAIVFGLIQMVQAYLIWRIFVFLVKG